MNLVVKICGITNPDDALRCAETGADALGFIFYEGSPRWISPESAERIIGHLPPSVTPVGVFVNESRPTIERMIRETGIRVIQLSGDETPDDCKGYSVKVWKAFRFRHGENVERARDYALDAALLDGFRSDKFGGTGTPADQTAAIAMKNIHRVVLAGGLNPSNISDAVRTVSPFAVDINSGIESEAGKKDPSKIAALFNALKEFRT
ncbi:MAG TPA: phosphoribosylanthranilate isomerase [Bacteroidota bacterium]|nr:phosphoribosylanthranilate isomerase [Bacteroidota bacterium]